jgi:serine beta-lactamase-like protein LACTB
MRAWLRAIPSTVLCGILALGPAPTAAEVADARSTASARLADLMARRRIPGLSIAVGLDGELVWAAAFGVSDLDTKAPVTTESVFPLGSTTKTLTALVLGQLVEEGRLDLDAPIQAYVPGFPKKGHVLTARLLAGHLTGIRDYDMAAGEYANTREFRTVEEAVAVFKDDPLRFEPGTRHEYSAYNFVLLSAAIEGAAGREFLSAVADRIAAPLGLTRTGPNRRSAPPSGLVSSYAAGFYGVPARAAALDLSNKWAAGGFVSTPTEMVRLGNAVLQGKVVRPETFTVLTTPQKLKDGTDGHGYALGFRSGRRRLGEERPEVRVVHHGGTANGAMSFFLLVPEARLVVALQGNLLFQPFSVFSDEVFAIAELFRPTAGAARRAP